MTAPPVAVAVARADSATATPESIHPPAFEPYIPPEAHLPELTVLPLMLGTLLGAILDRKSVV